MESFMVTQDAYDKLHKLEIVTAQNTETLKEVKNVLVNSAVTNERLNNIDKRQDNDDVRHEKLEQKVLDNHNKIIYASGGFAALVFTIGTAMSLIK